MSDTENMIKININRLLIVSLAAIAMISVCLSIGLIYLVHVAQENTRVAREGFETCRIGLIRADAKLEQVEDLLGLVKANKQQGIGPTK